jgi:hypothetical protein
VIPSRFRNWSSSGYNIFGLRADAVEGEELCRGIDNDRRIAVCRTPEPDEESDDFRGRTRLRFSVQANEKLFKVSSPSCEVKWEVSNAGQGWAVDHHECYEKGETGEDGEDPKHRFRRWVCYEGTHLLRVEVIWRTGGTEHRQSKLFQEEGTLVVTEPLSHILVLGRFTSQRRSGPRETRLGEPAFLSSWLLGMARYGLVKDFPSAARRDCVAADGRPQAHGRPALRGATQSRKRSLRQFPPCPPRTESLGGRL